MKISSISRPISFTYNEIYHNRVKSYLLSVKEKDLAVADTLLDLEENALRMEDGIIYYENQNNAQSDEYKILTECLVGLKLNIAKFMEKYFPKLNYRQESIEEYGYERDKMTRVAEEYYWRNDLCKKLSSQEAEPNEPEETATEQKPKRLKLVKTTDKPNNDDEAIGDLLTEFYPTSSSPKSLADIVGMEETKQILEEEILDYIRHPELKELDKKEYGIEPCATLFFYGPPGCGKTYLTEALAIESGLKMYKMDISKIGSKYVNETPANIQKAFDNLAETAKKDGKPILLFMDEIDSIGMSRENYAGSSRENSKTTSTLLKLIQEAKDNNIIIIAATNRRNLIDAALLNRFQSEIYFGLYDEKGIQGLLKEKLGKIEKGKSLSENEEALSEISKELTGYSNRSIVHIINKSAKIARRNSRSEITIETIRQAIKDCNFEKIDEKSYRRAEKRRIGFGAPN